MSLLSHPLCRIVGRLLNYRLVVAIVFVATLSGCTSIKHSEEVQLTPPHLTKQPPIGMLGMPLGTVTEIEATIIAGRELRSKQYDGQYLLRVTAVAGRPIEPQPIRFYVPSYVPAHSHLAANAEDLYELKNKKKARGLGFYEMKKLEEGYVGKKMRLLVYETGGYDGIPQNLPEWLTLADVGYAFRTWLEILEDRPVK